jgi:hypothetical protein
MAITKIHFATLDGSAIFAAIRRASSRISMPISAPVILEIHADFTQNARINRNRQIL